MRLALKLTAYLLAAFCAVFAVDTYLGDRLYERLSQEDIRRDHRVLARALSVALADAWRNEGEAGALAMLQEVAEREGQIRVRWVLLDAPPGDPRAPDVAGEALIAATRERRVVDLDQGANGERRFYTYARVPLDGAPLGALEISDSLADAKEYGLWKRRLKLWSAASTIGVWGLLAWLAGIRLVGRPVQQLVEHARRMGAGDFSRPLILRQRDELSELSAEMNTTAQRLDAARRRLDAETGARIEALEQLRHADRLTTVGKLASGIAHELGTPLNIVSGRAQMIASGETESREESADLARIIIDQAGRMTGIVRQLLDFARRRKPERRSTDLVQLSNQTAALLAPLAAKRGVSLTPPGAPQGVTAEIDAGQMQQALTNLIVNAVQASRTGGKVAIEVGHGWRSPLRTSGADQECVQIAVRDEGEGIPEEERQAIFDPFFTTKDVGQGTGLGLSVAHGIVEEHGGWIDVESEPGKGSCFTICLPAGA